MNVEAALIAALRDNPDDRLCRSAYADWLEEQRQGQKAAALRVGVVKRFGVDFDSPGGALTLSPGDLGSRPEPDGWTVSGETHEDWYEWVNDFDAAHPTHGVVWGDFEALVFASSEEAFRHFLEHHPPSAWDYHDI